MKILSTATHRLGLALLLVLAGLQSSGADTPAEVAALHAVDDVWVKAFNAGDADTVAGQYDEHAVLLPPGAKAVHGRDAIHTFFAKMAAEATRDGVQFALDSKPAGGARGDLGWASGNYSLKDKTGKVIETGKYLSVSRKKDGKWLYVRDTWNSDAPETPAAPAAPAKK